MHGVAQGRHGRLLTHGSSLWRPAPPRQAYACDAHGRRTRTRTPRLAAMSSRSDLLRRALAERVVVADGAMGTMLQAAEPSLDDFQGHEGCNEILNVTRPDVVAVGARRLLRGRRRLRRDQHLRRQPGQPRRVRHRATGSASSPRAGAAIAREAADAGRPPTTRASSSARWARAPSCPPRPHHLRRAARRLRRAGRRAGRRRRGRRPHRDRAGPAAGQGRGHRRAARASPPPAPTCPSSRR